MGLDMYLEKAKRIGNVTPQQLRNIDNYFEYLERPEKYKNYTLETWCRVNRNDIDMSLVDAYRDEYVHRYGSWDTEKKFGWKTIFSMVADWRKANHIHNWFVNNVQDGVDDCGIYEVTREQLEDLLDVCKRVIAGSKLINGQIKNGYTYENGKETPIYEDGEYIEDSSIAEELLPTTSGFFFGSTAYDQWYYADVEDTIKIIEHVLDTTNFEHEIVMYSSSW